MPSPAPCPCGQAPIIRAIGTKYRRWQIRCPTMRSWAHQSRGCGMSERVESTSERSLVRRWNEALAGESPNCPVCGLRGEHVCLGSAWMYARSGRSVSGT